MRSDSNNSMNSMFLRDAYMNLASGIIGPFEQTILSDHPLPDSVIAPYVSLETDAAAMMDMSYRALSVWIDEAKKANYFNKHFVILSRMIMNGVATMARGLMSLHTRGEDLSQAPMSIEDLISVGSYHIRKSYLGVLQTSKSHPEIGERLLLNQLGWTNTMMRLFKTRDKLSAPVPPQKTAAVSEAAGALPEKDTESLPGGNNKSLPSADCSEFASNSQPSALTEPGAFSAQKAFAPFSPLSGFEKKGSASDRAKEDIFLPEGNGPASDPGHLPSTATEKTAETSDDPGKEQCPGERACDGNDESETSRMPEATGNGLWNAIFRKPGKGYGRAFRGADHPEIDSS